MIPKHRESICGGNHDSGIAPIPHARADGHGDTRRAIGQILAVLSENSKGINELKSSMSQMRTLKTELMTWKPEVDNRVH